MFSRYPPCVAILSIEYDISSSPIEFNSSLILSSILCSNDALSSLICSTVSVDTIPLNLPSNIFSTIFCILPTVSSTFPVQKRSTAFIIDSFSLLTFTTAVPTISTKIPCLDGASATSVVIEIASSEIVHQVSKNGITSPPFPLNTLCLKPVTTIALSAFTFLHIRQIISIIATIIVPEMINISILFLLDK